MAQYRPKVVVVGGGFGGLAVAKELTHSDYDVTLIDRTNHHLFQPLLYQVATAALSPGDIAMPIRAVFRKEKNISVVLSEAVSVDEEQRVVVLADSSVPYDYLVVATGTKPSYFGHDEWEQFAPGLKTLEDALGVRENMLLSLEQAERTTDKAERERLTTFVIVGGGPTGVEMAGSISEIARKTMAYDYRNIDTAHTRIYLIEGGKRILSSFDAGLSDKAQKTLEKMGVTVQTDTMVTDITAEGVRTNKGFIPTSNIIWAAGNTGTPLLQSVDAPHDKMGRVMVDADLSIPGYDNIFVIGDAANCKDEKGNPLPGVAQVALQQGKYVAQVLKDHSLKNQRQPFRYNDKGSMATIGRAKAVAEIGSTKLTGFLAWLVWSVIHIAFLIGFRSRIRVMLEWMYYYITFRRGIRLIVGKINPLRIATRKRAKVVPEGHKREAADRKLEAEREIR